MTIVLQPLNKFIGSETEDDLDDISQRWDRVKSKLKPEYVKTIDIRLSRVLKMREQFLINNSVIIREPLQLYLKYQTATVSPKSVLTWLVAILLLPIIVPILILIVLRYLIFNLGSR